MRRTPRPAILLTVALLAAACSSTSGGSAATGVASAEGSGTERGDAPQSPDASLPGSGPNQGADAVPCTADPISSSPRDITASGLEWIFGESLPEVFPEPLVGRTSIVPVLQADGIPAIDEPRCLAVGGVDFLEDSAAVVAIEINGDARAYPLEIMTWHELVNDTIGGVPITISYCPLCNSAIAYDRRVGDRVLDFGTSGALSQSSMVMYDRQTQTLWTHFDGRAVVGELTGEQLEFFSTSVVSWADFRERFPDGLVLSRETGHNRDYGTNPYPGYELRDDPFVQFITDDVDDRLPPMARIIGIESDGEAVAVPHDALFDAGVVTVELAGRELTVWNLPGTSSALDARSVSGGIDVGANGVFVPRVDGQALTFARADDQFVDDQTGSSWDIFGTAVAGPLAGAELEKVPHLATFWFAWGTFQPQTTILDV